MGKSTAAAAANVIDLEAFRQKKLREVKANEETSAPREAALFVPVWFCWVPVWAPIG